MPSRTQNPARISIREIAEALGENPSTTYYRAATTGEVYPGVPAKRFPGMRRIFVSRAEFERVLGLRQESSSASLPIDWYDH